MLTFWKLKEKLFQGDILQIIFWLLKMIKQNILFLQYCFANTSLFWKRLKCFGRCQNANLTLKQTFKLKFTKRVKAVTSLIYPATFDLKANKALDWKTIDLMNQGVVWRVKRRQERMANHTVDKLVIW